MSLSSNCAAVAILVMCMASAAGAQEEGDAPEGGPRKGGWLQLWGGKDDAGARRANAKTAPAARTQPNAAQPVVPMVVDAGKLYLILDGAIQRLDAMTLEQEASAKIPSNHPEQMRIAAEQFMRRFDTNGDGEVTEDEIARPEMLAKLDVNGDGKITPEEAPMPRARTQRATPASLLVEAGNVYVFQSGQLFRFKADTLALEAQTTLGPADAGEDGGVRRANRQPERTRRRERLEQPPPLPDNPEETPRF